MAGRVESVGPNATRFKPGDDVFGECVRGQTMQNGGAYAEYVSVPEDKLALKPGNITFQEAAAVPTSGLIALKGICDQGQVQSGQGSSSTARVAASAFSPCSSRRPMEQM